MDREKILVLGIGNAQADLIEWCKDHELEVHACSYSKSGKGKQHVDYFELIDIKDAVQILQYVKAHKIDLVYSIGSDVAMPTIADVSEHSDVYSFINQNTANICQNKAMLRETLGLDFCYNIPFRKGKSLPDLESWRIYPAMLKPVDSQGQRGIYKVDSFEDVKANFYKSLEFSSSRAVIIEKYLKGDEISINAYLVDKEIRFFYTSDRISHQEFPGGIIKEHLYPSRYSYMEKDLKTMVSNTLDKLDIRNGPVYFQIKIANDTPYVIEATPRFDGCHMWRMIKMTKGIDLLKITMSHLIMRNVEPAWFTPLPGTNGKVFRLRFLAQPPLSQVDYSNSKKAPKHMYQEFYYSEGKTVPKMNGFIEKTGYYIDHVEK